MDFKLSGAGLGAVEERFDECLKQVIENVMDPNTDPTAKREIEIKFSYKPSKQDRGFGELTTSVKPTLATMIPLTSGMTMGINTTTGEVNARENVQLGLFDGGPGNGTPRTEDPIEQADKAAQSENKIRAFNSK